MADGAGVIFGLDWEDFVLFALQRFYVLFTPLFVWQFRGGLLLFATASRSLLICQLAGKELQVRKWGLARSAGLG
jgi:hypothetical protein